MRSACEPARTRPLRLQASFFRLRSPVPALWRARSLALTGAKSGHGSTGAAGQREATLVALALRACVCAVPRGRGQGRERRTPLAFRVAFSRDIVGAMEDYFPGLV